MTSVVELLVLLAIAIGLTFLVGRVLLRAGEPYLEEVFRDHDVASSVNRLLSVLFHLVTLGVLAIISTVDVGRGGTLQNLVTKIGVILLVLGLAYGISMLVLIRIRERRRAAEISERVQERLSERGLDSRVPAPPPGQPMGPPSSGGMPPADRSAI